MNPSFRLRDLSLAVRIGLTGVVASLVLGVWAGMAHLRDHHQNRDAKPGVSFDDLAGAYHGIDVPSPLVAALERGHPDGFASADRELLLTWLRSQKQSENYDNPDLGLAAPAEVLQRSCLACHSRKSTEGDGIGQRVPLEYWDDVEKVAFARRIDATPVEILVTSTHTHALSLAVVTLAVIGLGLCTRFSGAVKSGVALLGGVGLAADLAGWWLARVDASLVWLVIAGGACWAVSTVGGAVLVLVEMWLPKQRP
jgi:hypothetical protein